MRSAGEAYVALRLTDHHLELAALSRRDGATTARVRVDPFRGDQDGLAYDGLMAGGGAVAYHRSARGSAHDRLVLLDPVTLRPRWSVTGRAEAAIDCGPVVCVWRRDRMDALDARTGHRRWTADDAGDWWLTGTLVRIHEVRRWPGFRLRAADPRTGRVHWDVSSAGPLRGDTRGFSVVATADGRLAVVTAGAHVQRTSPVLGTTVRDGTTGRALWSRRRLAVQASGRTYLGLRRHHVEVLDPDTGRTRRSYETSNTPDTFEPPAVSADGVVWLPLRLPASTGRPATFLPVTGPAAGSYGLASPTVVFADELRIRYGRLRVGGRLRRVQAREQWTPYHAGSGRPAAMPRAAAVPSTAREPGEVLPHLVDRDGHAILVRAP